MRVEVASSVQQSSRPEYGDDNGRRGGTEWIGDGAPAMMSMKSGC